MRLGSFCPTTEPAICQACAAFPTWFPKGDADNLDVRWWAKADPVASLGSFSLGRHDVEETGALAHAKNGPGLAHKLLRGFCCRKTKIQERTL